MKNKNIPTLRFSEFKDEWNNTKFGDLVGSITSGKSQGKDLIGEFPFYGSTGIIGQTASFDYSGKSILVARVGANAGTLYKVTGKYSVSDNTLIVNIPEGVNIDFIFNKLIQSNLNKLIFGSGQPLITGGQLNSHKLNIPSLPEQQKIASFLTSVDERIQQLTRKKNLLERYKKSVMQKIFSREIKFKDDKGKDFPKWENEKIGKYLEEYVERVPASTEIPILTSSREGLFKQEEYFANRTVQNAGEYGVVPRGYFTYRHMSDDSTFKFNINTLCDRGAVSKEYPVFTTKNMDSNFLRIKLNFGDELKQFAIAQKLGGTRVRLYFNALKECSMLIPSLPEQEKIATFISELDNKILLTNTQLQKTQAWKKGLLQKMFV